MQNLTDRFIANIIEPGYYWDPQTKAFGIRVGKKTKTYVAVNQGIRTTIGHYPAMSLQEARNCAKRLSLDPKAQRASKTLKEAISGYYEGRILPNYRPMSAYRTKNLLNLISTIEHKQLSSVNHADIFAIIDPLPPSQANHLFAALQTFFNWCEKQNYAPSPIKGKSKPHKEKPRERVLSDEEITRIWKAAPDSNFGIIIKLLILTGQRRGEIAPIIKPIIENDTLTFPITKNGFAHTIPITHRIQTLIECYDWKPYSNYGKVKADLDKAAKVSAWTLHDLRRTFATKLAELQVEPHIIEAILNHRTGTLSPIARTYNRYHYLPQMEKALLIYDTHISHLISEAKQP